MSILIKGMEMPKDGCHHTICIYADGTVSTGGKIYMAVPVPPHGRLIDADKMRESIMKQTALTRLIGGEELAEIAETLEKGFLQEINNAPTIIPEDDKT